MANALIVNGCKVPDNIKGLAVRKACQIICNFDLKENPEGMYESDLYKEVSEFVGFRCEEFLGKPDWSKHTVFAPAGRLWKISVKKWGEDGTPDRARIGYRSDWVSFFPNDFTKKLIDEDSFRKCLLKCNDVIAKTQMKVMGFSPNPGDLVFVEKGHYYSTGKKVIVKEIATWMGYLYVSNEVDQMYGGYSSNAVWVCAPDPVSFAKKNTTDHVINYNKTRGMCRVFMNEQVHNVEVSKILQFKVR